MLDYRKNFDSEGDGNPTQEQHNQDLDDMDYYNNVVVPREREKERLSTYDPKEEVTPKLDYPPDFPDWLENIYLFIFFLFMIYLVNEVFGLGL